ncbi:MAG: intracellular sulfur oxidation DsrE/DsrF family protein [Gammaproteobacteria bacterium]|jgi:intracellular sulfur oxidation DsrE/DsrF family protein
MMVFTRRAMIGAVLALGIASPGLAQEDGVHRLALQISDNNPQKMTTVLNVAANVTRLYQDRGEEVEIRIVAFNAGLHMLREDTSPVLERLTSFGQSMPNVTFAACGNTITGMTKKEGVAPPISAHAEVVPAGVVELITLDQAGWTIIRP